MIQLPLTSDACRTFTMIFGVHRYRLTTVWNDRAQYFTLSIADGDTDEPIVNAIPLVLGADLLKTTCPRLGSMIVVDTSAEPGSGRDAGPDDLGSRVEVIWLEPGEVV